MGVTASGGSGGIALDILSVDFTVTNSGLLTGGSGGSGGLGGAGLQGAEINVFNTGTITGGMSGATLPVQADAIDFTGGANSLTLGTRTSGIYTSGMLSGGIGLGGTLSIDTGTTAGIGMTLGNTIHDYTDPTTNHMTAGSLTKIGAGILSLSGANAYTGGTTINAGTLAVTGGAALADAGAVTLADVAGATLEVNASETIGALDGGGTAGGAVSIASGATLTIAGNSSTTYAGTVSGAGLLTKASTGTLTLTGVNDFTGIITVSAGTLIVNGSTAYSAISVTNSGTLGGAGTVGDVIVASGGSLSPGNSPGLLNTGNLSLASGSTYVEQIGGTTPGMGYDTTNVTGTVDLGGATLNVASYNNFAPTAGQTYTIINNDDNDAVQGTFAGLAEGSTVSVNGVSLSISYHGGTGNDVTLTDPAPSSGGGGSAISTNPSSGPDNLTGTSGSDTIVGQAGDDTINGGGGNDLLLGNQGNDQITDGDGQNTVYGGMDNDWITVGNGANLLYGNEGSDTIQAGNGNNTIVGGQDSTDGADLITSGAGNDLLFGNGGDDTVAAGGGADSVVGGFGRDILLGNQGNDLILGNQGDDTLYGGQGADALVGGMGNDVLYGNEGDDVLYGNEGLNTFVFAPGDTDFKAGQSTGDAVMDFITGLNRIDFTSGPAGTTTNFGSTSTTSTDFASIQAAAQTLISGGDTYAFVSDGVDGFLFTTGGTGTAITDAVKLAGASTAGSVNCTDIAHGALA